MSWYKKSITQQDIEEFTRPKWIPVDSSFVAFVAYYKPLQIFEVKVNYSMLKQRSLSSLRH